MVNIEFGQVYMKVQQTLYFAILSRNKLPVKKGCIRHQPVLSEIELHSV